MSERKRAEFRGSADNRLIADDFCPDNKSAMNRPAALFMHGGGQTRHSWRGAAQQFTALGMRALSLDARGHGDSDWVEDKNYSAFAFRDDLRVVADELTQQHAGQAPILIGASMGGISAMLAQVDGNGRTGKPWFTAIILVDITPRMTSTGVDKILGFMTRNVEKGFASVEEAADVIAAYLPNRPRPRNNEGLRKNLRQRDDGRWYWHWDPAFVNGKRAIETSAEERQRRLLDATARIDVPTLLVRGSKSELVSQEAVEEFQTLVPHAKFVDVTDAGHMVAGDKNDVFASAVMQFLTENVLRAVSAR
ncbi:MAG: alpha/beta hydrolase [Ahrensia sp.]|nr:alpha/beta hydrolase [Ahrensia sp.]